jgi:hypothetical protein
MRESSSFDLQRDSKKKFYIEGDENPFTQFSSGEAKPVQAYF